MDREKGKYEFGRDVFKIGDHNVICDRSGRKIKASEGQYEWNGLFVDKDEWEPRHPQDFVRGRRDQQSVRINRPEAPDDFLTPNQVTVDDL